VRRRLIDDIPVLPSAEGFGRSSTWVPPPAPGPEGLLQGVHGALRPGGLLVGEIGMDGNLETFRRACYDVLWDEGALLHPSKGWGTPSNLKCLKDPYFRFSLTPSVFFFYGFSFGLFKKYFRCFLNQDRRVYPLLASLAGP